MSRFLPFYFIGYPFLFVIWAKVQQLCELPILPDRLFIKKFKDKGEINKKAPRLAWSRGACFSVIESVDFNW